MMHRKFILVVLALTGAALLLRLWGVGFGLPQEYHIDEHFYYPHAWSMGQGQLVLPDQAHGPSLYLGLLLIGQKSMQAGLFPPLIQCRFRSAARDEPVALSAVGPPHQRAAGRAHHPDRLPARQTVSRSRRGHRRRGVDDGAVFPRARFAFWRAGHTDHPVCGGRGLAVAARLPDASLARSAGRGPVRRAGDRGKVYDGRGDGRGDRRRAVDGNHVAAARADC